MSVSADILKPYSIVDGSLRLGGKSAAELARRYGTPLYVYDGAAVLRRIRQLREQLPRELALHYAIKANPMRELVQLMARQVDGMDVASLGELQLALDAGVAGTQISYAGPGKRDQELEAAIRAGVMLSIESSQQLQRAAEIGERIAARPRVALRINPAFRLKASGMHMGGGPSPFGIDEEMAPEVLRQATGMPVALLGLHIYAGSQNLSASHLIEAQDAIFALAERLSEHFPDGLAWLNIGGGFGIPYFPNDQALSLNAVADNLHLRVQQLLARLGETELVLELGRYLVGEAGVYLCRVIDRKVSRGQIYLVTDGGMHQHLAASGNLGQVIRKNFPVVLPERMPDSGREQATEIVSVVGPLCTPLDMLADRIELEHAEPGDLVAVLQSGAYGLSASPVNFLSHPPPREILV